MCEIAECDHHVSVIAISQKVCKTHISPALSPTVVISHDFSPIIFQFAESSKFSRQVHGRPGSRLHFCPSAMHTQTTVNEWAGFNVPNNTYRSLRRRVVPVNHNLTREIKRQNTQITQNNTTQKAALVNSTVDTLRKTLGEETGQTEPGLTAFYDIRPGNGAGLFWQPRSPHGATRERERERERENFIRNCTAGIPEGSWCPY